jgi:hypothetical protein
VYVEAALWIRETLEGIELPDGAQVLDAASSTEHYRTVEQPHIEREVLAPLRARGARVIHLDVKRDPGVDIVCDLTDPNLDPHRDIGSGFELVIAADFLYHIPRDDLPRAASVLAAVTSPGGYLLVACPESYRRTRDPYDSGYRPTPDQLAGLLLSADPALRPVATGSVRIDDRRRYKGLVSRASSIPWRGRWLPLPGFSEAIRRRIPRLRWRESCALLRKAT